MAHKVLNGLKAGPSVEVISGLLAEFSIWEAFNSSALPKLAKYL